VASGQWHAVVDVRPEPDFLAGHLPGAVSIPLAELVERVYELPPRDVPLRVFDTSACRLAEAEDILRDRGWTVLTDTSPPAANSLDKTGPSRVRLWRPNAFLESVLPALTPAGTALDIACGTGRDAAFLALGGWSVTAVDILPDAIIKANALAHRNAVSLDARALDTEREPMPTGPFDLVTCFSFLQRDLFPRIRDIVRPGGWVVYETFTVAHRERYGKPRSDAHLLRPGELPTHFPGWTVLRHEEGEFTPGRITARLLVQK
jgi:2-polyprenyl-3-methyl-5-hydroxy-6-metoxy-1,4-benzoquinol methylase